MGDFETGMTAAIRAHFGEDFHISGCHFHFCQAVYKNLVRFHMRQDYAAFNFEVSRGAAIDGSDHS